MCARACECAPCQWCRIRWAAVSSISSDNNIALPIRHHWYVKTLKNAHSYRTHTHAVKHMLTYTDTHTGTHHSNQSSLLFYYAVLPLLPLRSSFFHSTSSSSIFVAVFFRFIVVMIFIFIGFVYTYASLIRIISFASHILHTIDAVVDWFMHFIFRLFVCAFFFCLLRSRDIQPINRSLFKQVIHDRLPPQ